MDQAGASEGTAHGRVKKDKLMAAARPTAPVGPAAQQLPVNSDAIAKNNKKKDGAMKSRSSEDADLPPPAKKANVNKPESKPKGAASVNPYLVEIEKLKGRYIGEIKMLKAEIEELKEKGEGFHHNNTVNKLKAQHDLEMQKLKREIEELKHTIEAQRLEVRMHEYLVNVGAAVRGRWFELAKSRAGAGEPVAAIVEEGDKVINRGHIRADLAMLQLHYAALAPVQAAERALGNADVETKYKEEYFKDVYTLGFSEFAEHLKENFCSYPLKKLDVCELSGTMASLTGYSVTAKYKYMSLLYKFQAMANAADDEWAKHICHLWPDHQRRLNTASNWPPLELLIRNMRGLVEEVIEDGQMSPPGSPKSSLAAESASAGSPSDDSMDDDSSEPTESYIEPPIISYPASWNPAASK